MPFLQVASLTHSICFDVHNTGIRSSSYDNITFHLRSSYDNITFHLRRRDCMKHSSTDVSFLRTSGLNLNFSF
jgi:hypothetical protein